MLSGKILVIDDESIIRDGCCMVLSEQGLSVEVSETGNVGLKAAMESRYDVILLDLKLPDMDGMEILRTLRNERQSTYFIVITGHSTIQNAIEAMKLGAFDYLTKPFSEDELVLSVEHALEKKNLVEENLGLRKELAIRFGFSSIVGENPRMIEIFEDIKKVAPTDCTVLINGENGTGKELIAKAIHVQSPRVAKPFVGIDCCTLSPSLLESELFGHVKGSFTGALQDKPGIFELANNGTLFLDDIANLNLDTQGKLLRVLESREYRPVGATHFMKTNARVISATNRDLHAMVAEGTFREDLYYRLNVFPVCLPPLRDRKDDIPKLAYYFLRFFSGKTAKCVDGFTEQALEVLVNYEWPGNVRQLKNIIERLVIMTNNPVLNEFELIDNLQVKRPWKKDVVPKTRRELLALKKRIMDQAYGQSERLFLIKALEEYHGNITHAARSVGMNRSNFSALMKRHKLAVPPNSQRPGPPENAYPLDLPVNGS